MVKNYLHGNGYVVIGLVDSDSPKLKKILWSVLGSHMTDSGEYEIEDVDKEFDAIIAEIKEGIPLIQIDCPHCKRLYDNWLRDLLGGKK